MLFTTIVLCGFTILSAGLQIVGASTHWSYNHIEKWPGVCTTGKLQSPIDLLRGSAIEKNFTSFVFDNYDKGFPATMKNNKHSVEVRFKKIDDSSMPSVIGGSLPTRFILDHMHFHWESEHTINGHRFPLELHLVHYNSRFGNITDAKNVKGGLAVLGVLFNISPDDDSDMQQLVEIIDNIGKYPDKIVDLQSSIVPKNFLPCDTAGYYRYEGSLTTPGCDEVVIWTVFTNTLTISTNQVTEFESIQCDEGPLLKNYRPLQAVNDRKVWLKVSPINACIQLMPSISTTIMNIIVMSIAIAFLRN